ncbi:MAG: heavy-metal-associated domain-containing protein [Sphingomonas sp.]|nr:heavy-metal-associated domain-containing protein [Sphingomonas sp.]
MARRPSLLLAIIASASLLLGGIVYAQMEAGERGILPLDSSGTLEIEGITVDVGGKDAQSARFAGWRVAQRQGFKMLWAKSHKRPVSQAPSLSDGTLDQIVSSIIVQREQLGPNRYIATLGILFDRARAGQLLGIPGVRDRSQPMLLIPITITGGTATSIELRNPWQRAWAQFRTSQTPIDYVRVSGLGVDPLLINAAQSARPGRGWWRNILDLYGAADILLAEVMIHRLYPGGPAKARFIGRHGPDREIIGGFELTAANSAEIPRMMDEGARRMDQLFAQAFAAGALIRDPSLNLPEPPPPPVEEVEEERPAPQQATTVRVAVAAPNAATYNSALAHLRAVPGVSGVQQVNIALGDTSYFGVTYRGNLGTLRSVLESRGWGVETAGGQLRMFVLRPGSTQTPQQPQPQPQPAPAPAPSTPPQPEPQIRTSAAVRPASSSADQ